MINWIKKNWLVLGLILIIIYLLNKGFFGVRTLGLPSITSGSKSYSNISLAPQTSSRLAYDSYSYNEAAPSDNPNRLVIQDTSLSLVVSDVPKIISQIEASAKNLGGFLVSSNLNKPESSANGTIIVRVPEDKRTEALGIFKGYAVKVVSESVSGRDVTDQYQDLDARLLVLNNTKSKFEDILNKAVSVTDLLTVQRELINLQSQIDSVKGQQKYYEQSAKLTKITAHLSTDELALPYTPDNSWRPSVVLKEAVRSLITNLRGLGSLVIWIFIYTPIWLPILLLIWYLKRRAKNKVK